MSQERPSPGEESIQETVRSEPLTPEEIRIQEIEAEIWEIKNSLVPPVSASWQRVDETGRLYVNSQGKIGKNSIKINTEGVYPLESFEKNVKRLNELLEELKKMPSK